MPLVRLCVLLLKLLLSCLVVLNRADQFMTMLYLVLAIGTVCVVTCSVMTCAVCFQSMLSLVHGVCYFSMLLMPFTVLIELLYYGICMVVTCLKHAY